MAKHLVHCMICGEEFDTNNEEYVKPKSNRYAHKRCYEDHQSKKSQDQIAKEELEAYIKKLFNITTLTYKIKKQLTTYHDEYHYSYSAIHKTLIFFFDVQKNDLSKANGGIGIVPYAIEQASHYWKSISEAQDRNQNIDIDKYLLPQREIVIVPPARQPMRKLKNLFSFLEEE